MRQIRLKSHWYLLAVGIIFLTVVTTRSTPNEKPASERVEKAATASQVPAATAPQHESPAAPRLAQLPPATLTLRPLPSRDLLQEERLQGDWRRLLKGANQEIDKDPTNARFWYLRHLALFGINAKEGARNALDTALEIEPAYFEGALQWTSLYGSTLSSSELYDKWKENGFSDAELSALVGAQLAKEGDLQGAIAHYRESLVDGDGGEPLTRLELARVDQASGNPERALAELRSAYTTDPSLVEAGLEALAVLRQFGNQEEASSLLNKILSDHPDLLGGRAGIEAWVTNRAIN